MTPARFVALQLLLWVAIVAVFAALYAPGEDREPYWFLAAGAVGAWWLLRRRWR
jgi:MYXO-CTERM domain-containing protein